MPIAGVRGARIAYDDTGGNGPPVILAHGFLMDRTMFAPQVAALEATHRVITWDGRGWGDTDYDGEPFTYWDSAADCLGLLDHLGIDRAVVGGMSQGGFVSLRVALTAPERVRGLILIDTQAGPELAEVVPLASARSPRRPSCSTARPTPRSRRSSPPFPTSRGGPRRGR